MNDNQIILFYVIFMLVLNSLVFSYSGGIVKGTDYIDEQAKVGNTTDPLTALNWLLTADVPQASNVFWTTVCVRLIYLFIVFPYTLLIIWIIAKFIRGIMS